MREVVRTDRIHGKCSEAQPPKSDLVQNFLVRPLRRDKYLRFWLGSPIISYLPTGLTGVTVWIILRHSHYVPPEV